MHRDYIFISYTGTVRYKDIFGEAMIDRFIYEQFCVNVYCDPPIAIIFT